MLQEIKILDSSLVDTRGEIEDQSLLQNKVGLNGLVLPKVHSSENPADLTKKNLYMKFLKANPLLSNDELLNRFRGIPEEIVEKVKEGFECLKEAYHLYGLERIRNIEREYDLNIGHLSSKHYNKCFEDLKANHTFRVRLQSAIIKALDFLVKSQDYSLWVSYFKYKTCAFFSAFEGQEIPPAPVGLEDDNPKVLIFPGWVRLFKQKCEKRGDRSLFMSFLMTINQAKMGMPRDVKESIKKAELKCATHLTTVPPPLVDKVLELRRDVIVGGKGNLSQEDIDFHELKRVVINKEAICNQLRRTVREMYKDVCYTRSAHYEPFYPSTSSNYNRTRGAMGAVGEVMEFIREDEDLCQYLDQELIKMNISPVIFREEVTRKYGDRGLVEQENIDPDRESTGNAVNFFDEDFKLVWRKMFDRLFEKAYIEQPYVEPLGLLEALKIRVISKGPPFLYTVLKPLQKFLWGVLKKHQVFQLIGTPITVELINKVMGAIEDSEILVNGDYKASTDNLHSWVSECLANELCDVLNENSIVANDKEEYFRITGRHREMLIRSLIHHKFEIDGKWLEQQEGQLMGSITSFPFLCLANAAFCRWALELANNQEYRLTNRPDPLNVVKRAPLLVNGDDCTLKGNRLFLRKCWEEITSFGGLTSSVGKTFFSLPERPICMINSVAFDYDFETQQWVERKYVNMGILLGKKRSIGCATGLDNDQVSYGELGCLHRELFRQSPSLIWPQVSSRFIYYNANTLKSCPNIPWDMPEYLGGPGLVPNKPHSEEDLRCATLLVMNMKSDGGFHHKRLAVRKYTALQDWILHQVVQERIEPWAKSVGGEQNYLTLRNLNSFEYDLKSLDEIDLFSDLNEQREFGCPWETLEGNYAKLYKYLVIETLFRNSNVDVYRKSKFDRRNPDQEITISRTTHAQEIRSQQKALKSNMTAWSNVLKDIHNISNVVVLKDHEIAHEKKTFVIPVTNYSMEQEFYDDKKALIRLLENL